MAAVQFSGRRYISLESYTDKGEARKTLLQSMEYGGLLYVRTDSESWKVKRIQGNPHVRVMLSSRSGVSAGDWLDGEAHLLEGQENAKALGVFRKEYGAFGYSVVSLLGRIRGMPRMDAVVSIKLACGDTKKDA